jgi:hypothetical protein
MGFWETVAATALGAPLAALIIWLTSTLWRRFNDRHGVLILKRTTPSQWSLVSLSRRTLFEFAYWAVRPDGTGMSSTFIPMAINQDVPPKGNGYINAEDGGTVHFRWIDRARRSASVSIRDGVDEYQVFADPLPKRRLRFSA